jgi:fatty-acyl-CoA synthase
MDLNVGSLLNRLSSHAKPIDGNRTAVAYRDKRVSYFELHSLSNRLANKFSEFGIKKGDRVACLLYNCSEFWEIYFACAKVGAILVPLNFRLAAPELEFAINDSDPKILIFGESFKEVIAELESKIPGVTRYFRLGNDGGSPEPFHEDRNHLAYQRLYEAGEGPPRADVGPDDDLFIMYTSGTTGRPKGAVWTHGNAMYFSAMQIVSFQFRPDDISLLTGPLYHVGSLQDVSMPTFHLGATCVVLPSRGFSAATVLELIAQERVSKTLLFPVMLYDIIALSDLDQYDLGCLEMVITGGEPVPLATIRRFQERLPGVDLVQAYGLTEGSAIATACQPDYAVAKAGSAGKPILDVDVRIVDDEGRVLAPGETGEILTSGPAVTKGYWQRPEVNAETFVDGWCHTGDLGRLDEDGFLYIEGRKKDMIISGAENIYPAEIENVLFQHPKIHEAAVIGIPAPRWGEAVVAVVVGKPGAALTEEEVVEHCKKNLAGYKKPRFVVFAEALPRTPSQKVQKFLLREQYQHLAQAPGDT